MTNFWMTARHWASVASPVKQLGHRPQPLWGWPSGQMMHLRPCALSPSPAHQSCLT
uniref:Elongin B n=1 Tax=Molossus molossus TaxID=27622 RepID=A0A7J8IXI5_MOLMO|nr:elongin B [Molossus molossus]